MPVDCSLADASATKTLLAQHILGVRITGKIGREILERGESHGTLPFR